MCTHTRGVAKDTFFYSYLKKSTPLIRVIRAPPSSLKRSKEILWHPCGKWQQRKEKRIRCANICAPNLWSPSALRSVFIHLKRSALKGRETQKFYPDVSISGADTRKMGNIYFYQQFRDPLGLFTLLVFSFSIEFDKSCRVNATHTHRQRWAEWEAQEEEDGPS